MVLVMVFVLKVAIRSSSVCKPKGKASILCSFTTSSPEKTNKQNSEEWHAKI